MHYWPEKRSPRTRKDKRTHGKIGDGRWLRPKSDRRTDVPNPPLRDSSFTLLTAPIDQVLMQIKDKGALTFPGKLKGNPSKRSRDKHCHFYRDHDHDMSDCYDLKQQIEALIKQGMIQVNKKRTDPP